jgi:hypothetical protein
VAVDNQQCCICVPSNLAPGERLLQATVYVCLSVPGLSMS